MRRKRKVFLFESGYPRSHLLMSCIVVTWSGFRDHIS